MNTCITCAICTKQSHHGLLSTPHSPAESLSKSLNPNQPRRRRHILESKTIKPSTNNLGLLVEL